MDEKVMIKFEGDISHIQKEMNKLQKMIAKAGKNNPALNSMIRGYDKLDAQLKKAQARIAKVNEPARVPFAGWAMSIMFAGMAIQRAFTQIGKFGLTTFNEIAHSVEGVVTNTDMLQGSFKYLGFTIGAALEPFVAFLIPVIEEIAAWVEQNEEATAAIVAIGIALGTLMAVGGSLVLAINGFKELNGILKSIGAKGGVVGGLGGAVAITYAIEEAADAWSAFKDGKFATALVNAVSSGLMGVGGIRMIKGAKGGGALIAIGVSLDLIESGKFLQTIASVLSVAYALTKSFTDILASLFEMGLKTLVDSLISKIKTAGFTVPVGLTLLSKNLGKQSSLDWTANFEKNYEDALSKLTPLAEKGDKKISEAIAYLDNPNPETKSLPQTGATYIINGMEVKFNQDQEKIWAPILKQLNINGVSILQ